MDNDSRRNGSFHSKPGEYSYPKGRNTERLTIKSQEVKQKNIKVDIDKN